VHPDSVYMLYTYLYTKRPVVDRLQPVFTQSIIIFKTTQPATKPVHNHCNYSCNMDWTVVGSGSVAGLFLVHTTRLLNTNSRGTVCKEVGLAGSQLPPLPFLKEVAPLSTAAVTTDFTVSLQKPHISCCCERAPLLPLARFLSAEPCMSAFSSFSMG
jgi:hypothetical protein